MATREQVCRVRLDLSLGASPEVVTETLAKVAGLAVGLCVEHGVGLVAMDWRAHPRGAPERLPPKGGVEKDLLPLPCPEALPGLWKDSEVTNADALARLRQAGTWQAVHREIKSAAFGVRRPHPEVISGSEGRARVSGSGYAVSRLGHRRRPGLVLRPTAVKRPGHPGTAAATDSRVAEVSP